MYFGKFIKLSVFVFILLTSAYTKAQDVEVKVSVIHPKVQISNTQIFTSLKSSIEQFVNQRLWCNDKLTTVERFKLNFLIDITKYELNSNQFEGTIQIQATRQVFGSTYSTVIFNQLDNEFIFQYQEFQAMEFQPNANVYNLTGVLAFYVNVIVGMQYDTYSLEAGTPYFVKAREILNASQSMPGWRPGDGQSMKNRYYLIDNLTSERYAIMRKAYYNYHLNGLDYMHKDVNKGRDEVFKAMISFEDITRTFPNSMLVKVFFNAKYRELIEIFKGAPSADQQKAIELFSKMDPANRSFYETIKT